MSVEIFTPTPTPTLALCGLARNPCLPAGREPRIWSFGKKIFRWWPRQKSLPADMQGTKDLELRKKRNFLGGGLARNPCLPAGREPRIWSFEKKIF
ncbi:MAG: hypothetical protein IM571_01075 [Chitinophagaceae bacterium]|nr:hypothetical protein [Chitinophagaceae bacterium]MCA6513095.1 hypothetical protein [Chitinophagaceae bacterium]